MKTQFIFLFVCVVVSFALPEGDRTNVEVSGQIEQQQGTSQGKITVDDEVTDSQEGNGDEQTVASNDTSVAEGRKCNNSKWRRQDRRFWLRREKLMRGFNNNDEQNSAIETSTPPENERGSNNCSHHRRGHRHRHHHHRHQPDNNTPTEATTSNTPFIEPSQE